MKPTRPRPGPVTLAFTFPLAALAYFLAAPALPALAPGDETIVVAGGIGVLLVAATTLALLPARETLIAPLLVILGSGVLVAALNVGGSEGVGAGANVVEALLASAVGLVLARLFATPMTAAAVPLFAAAIDVVSVWNGPTARMLEDGTDRVDALSFDFPAWGGAGSAGHLGLSDAVFLSMFAAWSERYGFRRRLTLGGHDARAARVGRAERRLRSGDPGPSPDRGRLPAAQPRPDRQAAGPRGAGRHGVRMILPSLPPAAKRS